MKRPIRKLRCAIYTRKSSEEGLEMEFNSLDAQREAVSLSQALDVDLAAAAGAPLSLEYRVLAGGW